jgi:hypothetical protein
VHSYSTYFSGGIRKVKNRQDEMGREGRKDEETEDKREEGEMRVGEVGSTARGDLPGAAVWTQ